MNVKIQCLEGRIDLITELVVGQWSMPVHEPTPTATNNHSNQIVLPPGSVELIITSAPLTTTNNPGAGGWERGCFEQQSIGARRGHAGGVMRPLGVVIWFGVLMVGLLKPSGGQLHMLP